MGKGALRWFSASVVSVGILVASVGPGFATSVSRPGGGDTPTLAQGAQPLETSDETEARLLLLDQIFTANRTAGDAQLSVEEAGQKRSEAAGAAESIKQTTKFSTGAITFNAAWSALKSGGRLVANAVSLETEARLAGYFQHFGGDLVRLQVARADRVGAMSGWRPAMPVTQWRVRKP